MARTALPRRVHRVWRRSATEKSSPECDRESIAKRTKHQVTDERTHNFWRGFHFQRDYLANCEAGAFTGRNINEITMPEKRSVLVVLFSKRREQLVRVSRALNMERLKRYGDAKKICEHGLCEFDDSSQCFDYFLKLLLGSAAPAFYEALHRKRPDLQRIGSRVLR
jgi:hypothetical protein